MDGFAHLQGEVAQALHATIRATPAATHSQKKHIIITTSMGRPSNSSLTSHHRRPSLRRPGWSPWLRTRGTIAMSINHTKCSRECNSHQRRPLTGRGERPAWRAPPLPSNRSSPRPFLVYHHPYRPLHWRKGMGGRKEALHTLPDSTQHTQLHNALTRAWPAICLTHEENATVLLFDATEWSCRERR